jgi:uncharacterized protein involved in response to NO
MALHSIASVGTVTSIETIRRRENALSWLVVAYIVSGLTFMLLPGTFLGVWNLIHISAHSAPISASWIQAHGHAQVFGWVGTFILGIGFYSIPKMRKQDSFALWTAWTCFGLWVSGVALRWFANIYLVGWRVLLPLSAAMELVAFLLFLRAVSSHKPSAKPGAQARMDPWIFIVIAGTLGLLATLLVNLVGCIRASLGGITPAFPHGFDLAFLAVCAWAFLVPFVWGFGAKWLPVFLGLRAPRTSLLLTLAGSNLVATIILATGFTHFGAAMFLITACMAPLALRLFEKTAAAPKTKDVHPSYPYFIRSAYIWAIVAAALGVWASFGDPSGGLGGASRHALTVGFVAMMIFGVGQRVLPAFGGMRILFSKRLMLCSMMLLTIGCALRVSSEILAYPGYWAAAWKILPVSAVVELTAVTIFALNLLLTFTALGIPSSQRTATMPCT